MESQSESSRQDNIAFFRDNIESYNESIQNLDTYLNIRSAINEAIIGIQHLLDIGNGGVFDYDVSLVSKIVGLDLFLDNLPNTYACPSNVVLKTGSALDIPEPNDNFDGVLLAFLIHHIIGKTVSECVRNVETTIDEAYRVLKPGGKMIIAESCVPRWFYQFEKWVFPLVSRMIGKLFKHPATLQYPSVMLAKMLAKKFKTVNVKEVPLGRWILIYGIKVPAVLTPVSVKLFIAEK